MQVNNVQVQEIPFSKLLDLELSDKESFLFMMKEKEKLHNHLQMIHAGALFTMAESTSGQFLLNEFSSLPMDLIPVIRKAEIKYSKPGKGTIYSNASFLGQSQKEIEEELLSRKKVIIKVKVEVFNDEGARVLSALFNWFVAIPDQA